MTRKRYTALYANEIILYFNEDPGDAVSSCNEMEIFSIFLNNNNVDNNFDEYDPDTIILIRLLAWHSKFKKRKAPKIKVSEESIPVA